MCQSTEVWETLVRLADTDQPLCTHCLWTRCWRGTFGSCSEGNLPHIESSEALPIPIIHGPVPVSLWAMVCPTLILFDLWALPGSLQGGIAWGPWCPSDNSHSQVNANAGPSWNNQYRRLALSPVGHGKDGSWWVYLIPQLGKTALLFPS